MSRCICTHPFGGPVVPDVKNHAVMSLARVSVLLLEASLETISLDFMTRTSFPFSDTMLHIRSYILDVVITSLVSVYSIMYS